MHQSKLSWLFSVVLFVLVTSCVGTPKKGFSNSAKTRAIPSGNGTSAAPLSPLKSPLTNDQEIQQQLTGKVASTLPTQQELKGKPLSTQHYYAGLRAAESKNYILAIKHFNTVLKKYPRSNEVKSAFASKAKVYREMGLTEPASLNMKMAQNPQSGLPRQTASAAQALAPQGKTKIQK